MNLLIVSDMRHYRAQDGRIAGWGPTVEEINHLAALFSQVHHIGFLYPSLPPTSSLPYTQENIRFIPVDPSGGTSSADKFGVLRRSPSYLRTIFMEAKSADAIHIRCPSSTGLLSLVMLTLMHSPLFRWAKYAGNWRPSGHEPLSYRLQRLWLAHGLHRGVVTVNGAWPGQPRHVVSFQNPSLTEQEIQDGARIALTKVFRAPISLLFVGRVEAAKGVGRLILIAGKLREAGLGFTLDIIGDGAEKPNFIRQVNEVGLENCVRFHGWLPRPVIADYYARAHMQVFPSSASEGWPKVLSEGMAYGVVPIAGEVSSVPQVLRESGAGLALPPDNIQGFVNAILEYAAQPEKWRWALLAGLAVANRFTYESYVHSVRELFRATWGVAL